MKTRRNTKVPIDMIAGTIHETNSCGKLEIVNYNKKMDVTIRFLNTGFEDHAIASNVRNGCVKDKLLPSVEGVGFYGVGFYVTKIKGKRTPQYAVWRSMIIRCYSKNTQSRQPTYKGCSVCLEWHNFQNFAGWFDENYIEGFELDKDVKIDGNRIYSPETCLFISSADNTEKARAKEFVFISPLGVRTEIYNLTKFCRDNDLQQSNMQHVKSGARKSHMGWTKG